MGSYTNRKTVHGTTTNTVHRGKVLGRTSQSMQMARISSWLDLELAADAGTANMYEQIMTVISNLISISVVDMAPIIS